MRLSIFWAIACLLLLAGGSLAQTGSVYSGQAPVASQSEEERADAFKIALAQVVIKLTGDQKVLGRPGVAARVAEAGNFVLHFQYRQEVDASNGTPTTRQYLVAQFDRGQVEKMLRSLGLPVWSQEQRPPLLVWLAMDSGAGPNLIGDAERAKAEALSARAGARGLSLVFPLLDLAETAQVKPNTVWRADTAALAAASARYQTSTLLIGRVARNGAGWRGQWTVYDRGQSLNFATADAELAAVYAAAADGAAERLGLQYAITAAERKVATYRVRIGGIATASDYVRLVGYLGNHSLVKHVLPEGASGDTLVLNLTLNIALERWLQLVGFGDVLRVETEQPAGTGLDAALTLVP